VVVGTATHANWPASDPVFAQESPRTLWQHTPVPSGAVPQWIIDEANEDLQGLVEILTQAGVEVYRPTDMDFVTLDGMYNYCPRDRLLIAGDTIVDPAMMYPCRDQEAHAYEFLLSHDHQCLTMPRDSGMILDAANVCRLNDTWLFLESHSGNRAAATWLQTQFPDVNIEICNFYAGVHIDSTIIPLQEGLVALNASRVTPQNCPKSLQNWDKIWVDDVVAQDFFQYPYASRWIAMNMLSIDRDTVIVDRAQTQLITTLERRGITVIPHCLRHSRTLGGGFHCVTLDLWRQHA
jgi:glycine amidinotransferase/scyllo-inosamine-4-phosphate amidinotransferase 1